MQIFLNVRILLSPIEMVVSCIGSFVDQQVSRIELVVWQIQFGLIIWVTLLVRDKTYRLKC
jgi:hypothetical protein